MQTLIDLKCCQSATQSPFLRSGAATFSIIAHGSNNTKIRSTLHKPCGAYNGIYVFMSAMKKIITSVILLVLFSSSAIAGRLHCVGIIDKINVSENGSLSIYSKDIYGDSSGRTICNLLKQDGIPVEICKLWSSQIMESYSSKRPLRIAFKESKYTSCLAHPLWDKADKPSTVSNW